MQNNVVVYTVVNDKDVGVMHCQFIFDFTPRALVTLIKKFNVQNTVIISGNRVDADSTLSGLRDVGFVVNKASNCVNGVIDGMKREIALIFPNSHASVEEIMKYSLYPAMSGSLVQLIIIHDFPFSPEMDEYVRTRLRLAEMRTVEVYTRETWA